MTAATPRLPPAPCWRRLAASALDTFALLVGNALVFAVAARVSPESAPQMPLAAIGMAAALLYLWICWAAWGMTFGKWLLGIRVVAADGSRLSWPRALARVGAYLVASAPLKLGLAAMLWDERRRGWHDHLAGTAVVVAAAAAAPSAAIASPSTGSGRVSPRFGGHGNAGPTCLAEHRPRGRLLAAAMVVLYLGVAVGITMPLALHFSTHVPGAQVEGLEQDGYVFLWDYWWVRKAALDPTLRVTSTRYLFWPNEISLRYHTLALLHSGAAAILQSVLTLVQTYNLLLLFSLATSAWGMFLLCRYLTGNAAAAAAAGLAFGFCPFMTTHALAHQNLIAAEWLAPLAYCALRALRERRFRQVLGAAASWALVGLCEWYYFLYGGMLLVVLLVAEVVAGPRQWRRVAAVAAGIGALTLAALSPLLLPMLAERAQAGYMQQPLARGTALGGQPELYLIPAFTHPLLGRGGAGVLASLGHSRAEATLYLGLCVLALAITGIVYRRHQAVPWTAGAAFFLLLALGPYLRIGQRTHFNALGLLLLGGAPGNGFDLPLSAALSSRLAMGMVSGTDFLTARTQVPLPYLWLWRYVPVTRLAAVPTRAALPGMLCLCALAALGLSAVWESAARKWRPAIAGAAAVLIVLEFVPAPYPLRDARVPDFYHDLARAQANFAVAEVPLLGDYAVYMYYQTAHGKPILAGLVSREPPHALDFVRGNALLRDLQPQRQAPPTEPVLRLTRGGALERSVRELRAAYAPAAAELRRRRVGVIAAHRDLMTAADAAALDRVLAEALGLKREDRGAGIIAYWLLPTRVRGRRE